MIDVVADRIGLPQALRCWDGALYFSDSVLGTVHRWNGSGPPVTVARIPGAGGLGRLPDGQLLVVSTTDQHVYRCEPNGTVAVHADLSAVAGGPLNDLITDEQGRAYVGDYGFDYERRTRERPHSFLYRPPGPPPTRIACLAPDGTLLGRSAPVLFPNGCAFTDDGRTLIVAETLAFRLTAFTVADDGTLVDRRLWGSLVSPTLWRAVTRAGLIGELARRASALLDQRWIASRSRSPIAPDDLALDPSGSMWVANSLRGECVLIGHGGNVEARIPTGGHALSCVLSEDGRTLYVATVPTLDPARSARVPRGRIERHHLPARREGVTAMRNTKESTT